ncbi:hypothetical protein BDD21_5319 [Thiocapsa rosea]|uniref:Uncharacterized protein n=1 Tax=Thiocapsa rosea TaxID=69360 RepID=A0A495VH01_9GAMM|nr:hypothetical protein BDD21_5319 [Thiocapsa rosea]
MSMRYAALLHSKKVEATRFRGQRLLSQTVAEFFVDVVVRNPITTTTTTTSRAFDPFSWFRLCRSILFRKSPDH